ncbi:Type I Iterative PKS [Knufia obscura]|uniref:Type I Iterative PKS n=1 Tax=Knufia obscura TaxID=1635080 RepID=A0ABR0RQW6_9EURO|nr:Type I Iterative PKS [Knufia obscura]
MEDKIEPIAIVGLSCRFPGDGSTPGGLWDMMSEARRGHSKIPADRFNADTWYHPNHDRRGAVNVKDGFFLKEDVSLFDAPFFSITSKEASGMDPMQRLLLEVSYETFENAGVAVDQLIGSKTSVFCGCFTGDYDLLSNHDIFNHAPNAATGTGRAMLSNRVSWFFDLRGASFTVDTACSSSLYALHSACQSLRLGESKQALVTGSNLVLYPSMMHSLTNMHFLSPDGICHSFDDRANGYARGEAIGGLLLKPLKQALADGDTIRAVIRGSGANQDGKTPGITQPSPESQADLIQFTYAEAGLDLKDTSYFEAHGTGTALGDPMELSAIGRTFGRARDSQQTPLYVGSIKTNIGHTEGCSGLAGVIKSVLCLERGLIPPNAGFEKLNPKLKLNEWKLALPQGLMSWPTPGQRRVSVNSFGYGGANAHVILDDAYHYLKQRGLEGNHNTMIDEDSASDSGVSLNDSETSSGSDDGSSPSKKLFCFSTQDQDGISRTASSYRAFLQDKMASRGKSSIEDTTYLDDLAYTLASRRTTFDCRSYATADSLASLTAAMDNGLPKMKRAAKDSNIMFICTGQGAQWAQMGRELLDHPVFRAATQESQKFLESNGCAWNVFEELNQEPGQSRIDSPEFSQPICTVLQISLITLLRHWGITPKATVGHSSGEIAAAFAAGYLSHADSIKAAYFRGVYSADVDNRIRDRKGVMMAAGVSEEDAQTLIKEVTSGVAVVACINSPSSVTLSGDESAIAELEALLKAQNKFARRLKVKTAYHSPHMEVIAEDYLKAMGDIKPLSGNGAVMFSSVSGRLATSSELDASYWVRNMVGAVRFSDAVTQLLGHTESKGRRKIPIKWTGAIEVGPHEALKGPVNQVMAAVDSKLSVNVTYCSLLLRGKDAESTALDAAGKLWSTGHTIDLARVNGQDRRLTKSKVTADLPPYSWNHTKGFWYEPRMTTNKRFKKEPRTDLLGAPIDNQNDLEPHWRNILRIPENPWMADHNITGTILYPGAGMIIMAIEAALQLAESGKPLQGVLVEDVFFGRGLRIPSAEEAVETSLSMKPHDVIPNCYTWTLYSLPPGSDNWTQNSSGRVSLVYKQEGQDIDSEWQHHKSVYEQIKTTSKKDVNIEKFYKDLTDIGMNYGPLFRNLVEAKAAAGTHKAHGVVAVPDTLSNMPHNFEYPHLIHPATLDAIFHLLFVGFTAGEPMREAAVPIKMSKLYISADCPQGAGSKYFGYTEGTLIKGRDLEGDLVMSDESWSEPKLIISIAAREVSSSDDNYSAANSSVEFKRTARPVWKEDFDFMTTTDAENFVRDHALSGLPEYVEPCDAQLALMLDHACHKHADIKALFLLDQVNTAMKSILLEYAPKKEGELRFRECVVSSQDGDLLEALQADLELQGVSITYRKVDPTLSALEQGLSPEAYNYNVIAALDVQDAIRFTQPTLAQNAKVLIVSEKSALAATSEARPSKSILNGHEAQLFIENESTATTVVSTGYKDAMKPIVDEIMILKRPDASQSVLEAIEKLVDRLIALNIKTTVAGLEAATGLQGKGVISFMEAEKPLTTVFTSGELELFKQLIAGSPYMLWITRGGQLITEQSLDFAATTGMLRTVRTEVPQIRLPHLDIAATTPLEHNSTIDLITKVFNATINEAISNPEMEFAEQAGKVKICRVVTDQDMDRELELFSDNVRPDMAPLHQHGRPLRLQNRGHGPDGVNWIDDEEVQMEVGASEVEVKVDAVPITKQDVSALANGGSLGRIAAGTVTRVGTEASEFSEGQQVVVMKEDCYRTHLRQVKSLVWKAPASLSPETSATYPLVYAGALHVLNEVARISGGDKVLVEAAHTSTGQALVHLARMRNIQVYAIASQTGHSTLADLGLAEDRVFDQSGSWASRVRRQAGTFDVILSSSSGRELLDLCSLAADGGRMVDMSADGDISHLDAAIFKRNVSYTHIDFEYLLDGSGQSLLSRQIPAVLEMLESGAVGLLPQKTFSISELSKATEALNTTGSNSTVFSAVFDEGASVPVQPELPASLRLNEHGTYILSGGLGGLGANIAETMFQAGARHIVFLSRSGATTPAHQRLLDGLRDRGCKAEAMKCDITDENQMKRLQETATKEKWQIKGCMQLAMVLRDSVLENMTYDKWLGATQCKIPGTFNLHTYMPHDMDFFICLSSVVSVIGNTGQANYAAGNSYIDGLCNLRRQQGLPATSLNIGLVSDATHFTADFTIEDFLNLYGHLVPVQVTDKEINIAIAAAMKGQTANGVEVPPQVVIGIRGDLDREGGLTSLWPNDRKFDHRALPPSASGTGSVQLKTLLAKAGTAGEAAEAVEDMLKSNVAVSMGSTADNVDVDKPLHSFGIDSLKAVEVRNWLFREAKADLSIFDILSPTPLKKFAVMVVSKSKYVSEQVAEGAVKEMKE